MSDEKSGIIHDDLAKSLFRPLCHLDRKIKDLSQGNKKKVAIVQSLLHQPLLLILDEPTSGPDPLMRNRFFELLKEENTRGTTIFFSSHVLSDVEKFCHRVAIIKEGEIINEDSVRAIKEKSVSRVTYLIYRRKDILI